MNTLGNGLQSRRVPRVGQNHIYTVYIQFFLQGNCQIYGHIMRKFTVLDNPTFDCWPYNRGDKSNKCTTAGALNLCEKWVTLHMIMKRFRVGQNYIYIHRTWLC